MPLSWGQDKQLRGSSQFTSTASTREVKLQENKIASAQKKESADQVHEIIGKDVQTSLNAIKYKDHRVYDVSAH